MNASIFFAQFWGWLTVIVTAIFFARPSVLVDVKRLIVENRSFGISYGLASLILGLASVILHIVWVANWQVIITVAGWLTLAKGIIVLAWPEISRNTSFEVRMLKRIADQCRA
jgi:hypothetical protein